MKSSLLHYKVDDQRFVEFDSNGYPIRESYCACGRAWPCKKAPKRDRRK